MAKNKDNQKKKSKKDKTAQSSAPENQTQPQSADKADNKPGSC